MYLWGNCQQRTNTHVMQNVGLTKICKKKQKKTTNTINYSAHICRNVAEFYLFFFHWATIEF